MYVSHDYLRKIQKVDTCNRPWGPIGLWDVKILTFY
jgi:hypothetical protein